jgi:excisionase family DNA binding protein
MDRTTEPEFIVLTAAAVVLDCSPRTLRRRIAEGHLTGYKMAGSREIRVRRSDLYALLNKMPAAVSA